MLYHTTGTTTISYDAVVLFDDLKLREIERLTAPFGSEQNERRAELILRSLCRRTRGELELHAVSDRLAGLHERKLKCTHTEQTLKHK